jgi:hypothetical protein
MGSLKHLVYAATNGSNTPNMIGRLPGGVSEYPVISQPQLNNQLQWNGSIKSPAFITMLPFSANGSVRGSVNCSGILGNNASGVGNRSLRPEAIDPSQGIYCPQGFANGQQIGLASLASKPINSNPILNTVSQINPSLINSIPQPGFFNKM